MNMMNKCAKFDKDSSSDKKHLAHLPTFPLNFFMQFSHKIPLYFSTPWRKEVKNDQNLKSRAGPTLNYVRYKY